MLKAVTRSSRLVDDRVAVINRERQSHGQNSISIANFFDHYATETDTQIAVTEEDFISAKSELVPSVSVDELSHYERVRNTFEGATKKPESDKGQETNNRVMSPTTSPRKRVEFSKRPTNGSADSVPTMNGNARLQNAINQGTAENGISDADDDYVIRTDKLSLSSNPPSRPPSSRGKGKGKARDAPAEGANLPITLGVEQSPGAVDGEDLYD